MVGFLTYSWFPGLPKKVGIFPLSFCHGLRRFRRAKYFRFAARGNSRSVGAVSQKARENGGGGLQILVGDQKKFWGARKIGPVRRSPGLFKTEWLWGGHSI